MFSLLGKPSNWCWWIFLATLDGSGSAGWYFKFDQQTRLESLRSLRSKLNPSWLDCWRDDDAEAKLRQRMTFPRVNLILEILSVWV